MLLVNCYMSPELLSDRSMYIVQDLTPRLLCEASLIFSQSIGHPSMQAWNMLGQRPAAVTNPVVRVCFCDGPFFTNAAMTVATATTNSAAIRFRCHVGLCPCLFRGTSLDQKKTLVVHPVVFLSHPSDHSVAHINRIKSHLTFLLQGSLTLRLSHQSLLMFNLR
jgi:hypothetical protein